jgi:small-conductance mechanosensitive channel
MDLQERHQLDVAARVHKVRDKAGPWRSILALIIAIAGAVAAEVWGARNWHQLVTSPGLHTQKLVTVCGAAVFFVFGMIAAVSLSGRARSTLQPVIGQAHAGIVRYVLVLAGVFAILTISLSVLGLSARNLVVGGAVTGVLLGIAAQQSLANLFAGLVLLFASPFRVGDHVRFRAGALSGQIEGIVTDLSLTYVRLETDEGRVLVPNSQALAAAVVLVPGELRPGSPPTPMPASGPAATPGIPPSGTP